MPQLTQEQVRQKYMKMVQSAGVDKAITAIHNEMGSTEPRIFDGGYNSDRFQYVQFLRELARELYGYKLEQESKIYYEGKK